MRRRAAIARRTLSMPLATVGVMAVAAAILVMPTPAGGQLSWTDAMMRIDVDVYRGASSMSPEIQLGELLAVISGGAYLAREQAIAAHQAYRRRSPVSRSRDCPAPGQVSTGNSADARGPEITSILNAVVNNHATLCSVSNNLHNILSSYVTSIASSQPVDVNVTDRVISAPTTFEPSRLLPLEACPGPNEALFGSQCLDQEEMRALNLTTMPTVPGGDFPPIHTRDSGNPGSVDLTSCLNLITNQSTDLISRCRSALSPMMIQISTAAGVARVVSVEAGFLLSTVPAGPDYRDVRRAIVGLANLAAEYHNQLVTRADSLLLLLEVSDRDFLPPSAYLRNAGTTAFLNTYEWYDALPQMGDDAAARVRTTERLYEDSAWLNVNTVYATGEGDVAMAFIRDEIGNWSLKSFETDPSQIIETIGEAATAAAQIATDVLNVGGGTVFAGITNAIAGGRLGDINTDAEPHAYATMVEAARTRAADEIATLRATTQANLSALGAVEAEEALRQAFITARNGLQQVSDENSTACTLSEDAEIDIAGLLAATVDDTTLSYDEVSGAECKIPVAAIAEERDRVIEAREQANMIVEAVNGQVDLILQRYEVVLALAEDRIVTEGTGNTPVPTIPGAAEIAAGAATPN